MQKQCAAGWAQARAASWCELVDERGALVEGLVHVGKARRVDCKRELHESLVELHCRACGGR